jgi:hypothetical protein
VKLSDDRIPGSRESNPPLLKLVHNSAGKSTTPVFDQGFELKFLNDEELETILDTVCNMIAADAEAAKATRKLAKASRTGLIYEREIQEAGKQLRREVREVTKLREEVEAFLKALFAATTRMVETAGTLTDARNAQFAVFLRAYNGR